MQYLAQQIPNGTARGSVDQILKEAQLSASIAYSDTCRPHSTITRAPKVRTTRVLGSPVEVLRDMFADNPKMRVTEDHPSGIIRLFESDVPIDILGIKIHHISFDDEIVDPEFGRMRGPNIALFAILGTPEVKNFEEAHHILYHDYLLPSNAFDTGQPVIAGELTDVTVSQALDYTLKASPGYWVYENCNTEDGGRKVFFWFYRTD